MTHAGLLLTSALLLVVAFLQHRDIRGLKAHVLGLSGRLDAHREALQEQQVAISDIEIHAAGHCERLDEIEEEIGEMHEALFNDESDAMTQRPN